MLFFKIFLILCSIIAIFCVFILFLKFFQNYFLQKKNLQARLNLKEQLLLDNTRKVTLIEFDGQEFLIFLGLKNEFLISKNLSLSENIKHLETENNIDSSGLKKEPPLEAPSKKFSDMI